MRIIREATLVLVLSHSSSWAAEVLNDCPIEEIAAQIRTISGGRKEAFIMRKGKTLAVSAGACVLYDDKVEAGPGAQVTIEAPAGVQTIPRTIIASGAGPSTWTAPPAQSGDHRIYSDLSRLWRMVAEPVAYATGAIGRGTGACPVSRPATQSRLEPIRNLSSTEQTIGADLSRLVAAWRPLRWPADVSVTLRNAAGEVLAEDRTCADAHVALSLKAGMLTPGDTLTLQISDGPTSSFLYAIKVVAPGDLQPTPTNFSQDWMAGAWRIMSGAPETHLDSLARLSVAPAMSFGAKRLMDVVLSNVKF